MGTVVIPFLQRKKLDHREWSSQGHIANKCGNRISKLRQYDSNTCTINLPFRLCGLSSEVILMSVGISSSIG